MRKPIKFGKDGDEAAGKLYDLIGDDQLMDDLYTDGKKNPNGDARPLVKAAMKRLRIREGAGELYPHTVSYQHKSGKTGSINIHARDEKEAKMKARRKLAGKYSAINSVRVKEGKDPVSLYLGLGRKKARRKSPVQVYYAKNNPFNLGKRKTNPGVAGQKAASTDDVHREKLRHTATLRQLTDPEKKKWKDLHGTEFKEGSQKPYVSMDSGHPDGPQAHVMNSQGEIHKSWPMKHKQRAMNYLHKNYDKLRESNVPLIGRVSDLKRKGQAARTMAMATGDHGKITMDDYTTDGGGGSNLHKQYGLKKTIHKDADGKRINHWSGGHKVSFQGSHKGLHDYAVNHLGYSRPGHLSGHPSPTNTDAIQQHIGGSAAKTSKVTEGAMKRIASGGGLDTFKAHPQANKLGNIHLGTGSKNQNVAPRNVTVNQKVFNPKARKKKFGSAITTNRRKPKVGVKRPSTVKSLLRKLYNSVEYNPIEHGGLMDQLDYAVKISKKGEESLIENLTTVHPALHPELLNLFQTEENMIEALNLMQRMKRRMLMRKIRVKLNRGRKLARRKMADPKKLKRRAQRAARNAMIRKLTKGKSRHDIGPAIKRTIELRLGTPAMRTKLLRIQKRLFPKIRKAEMLRRKSAPGLKHGSSQRKGSSGVPGGVKRKHSVA